MAIFFYNCLVGEIGIEASNEAITHLYFNKDSPSLDKEIYLTPIIKEAVTQLKAYFAGRLRKFDLPLEPGGTAYMKKIWQHLCAIPYGETCTYGQLATKAGNPKAARAVGLACYSNPIPIIIPCHRVIGSNGQLTGYAGGLWRKQYLLKLEQKYYSHCLHH